MESIPLAKIQFLKSPSQQTLFLQLQASMIPLSKHASFHDVNCKLLVSAIIANIGQHAPFHILLPVFIAFQLHVKSVHML